MLDRWGWRGYRGEWWLWGTGMGISSELVVYRYLPICLISDVTPGVLEYSVLKCPKERRPDASADLTTLGADSKSLQIHLWNRGKHPFINSNSSIPRLIPRIIQIPPRRDTVTLLDDTECHTGRLRPRRTARPPDHDGSEGRRLVERGNQDCHGGVSPRRWRWIS